MSGFRVARGGLLASSRVAAVAHSMFSRCRVQRLRRPHPLSPSIGIRAPVGLHCSSSQGQPNAAAHFSGPKVARKARVLIELDMLGAEQVRGPGLTFIAQGAAPKLDGVMCYDAKNVRHTNRELARYIVAPKRVFKDAGHQQLLTVRRHLQCSFESALRASISAIVHVVLASAPRLGDIASGP